MKAVIVVALLVVAGVFLYSSSEKEQPNSIVLENIEALANNENDDPIICIGYGTVRCPINGVEVEYIFSGYR